MTIGLSDRRGRVEHGQRREFAFTNDDVAALSQLVATITGIHLSPAKSDMIYARLARRLRVLQLPDFTTYRAFIEKADNAAELDELVNALTTPVSHFWREAHHFTHLEQVMLPWVEAQGREARIWSAGCAAGQEAYTIAMVLERNGMQGRVLATDINTAVLKTAQTGIYHTRELTRLPSSWRERYWQPDGPEQWRADPSLKGRVAFRPMNLQREWPLFGKFDAIFCRNVMIYFDGDRKRRLLERFASMLQPGGWLYIGHSENILPLDSRFKLVGKTLYRLVD